jgi:hypothetical protein
MRDEIDVSRRQKLAIIFTQALRAHEMISDMMLFANPPEPIFEQTDVEDILRKVIDDTAGESRAAGIQILLRRYPNVPGCELDQTQICEAVKAIVDNAVEALRSGKELRRLGGMERKQAGEPPRPGDEVRWSEGEIRVQLWRYDADRIAIAVADDGPGVSPEIAEHIFDPFYSGREAGRGLGFGLTKAWRIAELHGGQLVLDRDFKNGARFKLILPVRQTQLIAADRTIDNSQAA